MTTQQEAIKLAREALQKIFDRNGEWMSVQIAQEAIFALDSIKPVELPDAVTQAREALNTIREELGQLLSDVAGHNCEEYYSHCYFTASATVDKTLAALDAVKEQEPVAEVIDSKTAAMIYEDRPLPYGTKLYTSPSEVKE
jgi:hypothetical protein